MLDLVKHLDKSKYDIQVLAFTQGEMIERLKSMGITTHVIDTETPFDLRVWRTVKKFIKKEKFDLVHAHGTRAFSNTFWASRSLKIPAIYTVHGWSFHPDQKPLVKNIRIQSEKFLSKKANQVVTVSNSNDQLARNLFGSFESITIKNGIDFEKFNPEKKTKDIRAEYGIPKDATLIGYIARITRQKDPLGMLKAFEKVSEKHRDIYLLKIGDGDLREETEAAVEILQKNGANIIFDTFRTDIPDVLAAIDVYCLPSLWEGLPIGLLEAMAMKKAVIASAVDGTMEVIKDGVNGLLVEPKNTDQLSDCIIKLHLNHSLRTQLGEEALKTVRENYSIQHMTKEVEKVYEQLLGSGETEKVISDNAGNDKNASHIVKANNH
ncbi:MAG: glycosyltransferase family 4 protein [Cyclobacteriaceae bacterium]|nr:glycosyltransferase family 4 protein [Cyclobacteriaceae bacterium]